MYDKIEITAYGDRYRRYACGQYYPDRPAHPPRFVVSEQAAEHIRNFPVSRHRSKRVHKKLVKRFGGEYRLGKPQILELRNEGIIMIHPSLKAELDRTLALDTKSYHDKQYLNGMYGRLF